MAENASDLESMRADVDALRERFPKTADLYRETCAIMFFRYGITPTTNALYQVVRKGSMSVPAVALRQFWDDLRRQTRVDVANAGLPEELHDLAGKLLGQLWSGAQNAADESVAHLKADLATEREALLAEKAHADQQMSAMAAKLDEATRAAIVREQDLVALREQLSAERATVQKAESQLSESRSQVERLQLEALATSRDHSAALDKVTARVVQAEERYSELEKRALVELDRERTAVGKLQKALENERQLATTKYDKLHSDSLAAQIRIARLEQALAAQRTEIGVLKGERDSAMVRAAEGRETAAALANRLAAEQARVEELRQQLRLLSEQVASGRKQKQPQSTQPRRPRKSEQKTNQGG